MVFGGLGASGLSTHQGDRGHERGYGAAHLRRNRPAASFPGARNSLQRRGRSAVAAGAVGALGDHGGRSPWSAGTQRPTAASPGPAGVVRSSAGRGPGGRGGG